MLPASQISMVCSSGTLPVLPHPPDSPSVVTEIREQRKGKEDDFSMEQNNNVQQLNFQHTILQLLFKIGIEK